MVTHGRDEVLAVSGQEKLAAGVVAVAGAFDVLSDIGSNSSGGPSMAPVEAEAGQLGSHLAQRYGAIEANLDTLV